jgi:shikimate kinase
MTAPSPAARRHLVLVGPMGAGKSTVGDACARRLGRPFVDTDEVVVATTGRSIPEIFASDGEVAFRRLERVAVADTCASPTPLVIACGGGAVLDADNRRALSANGVVVWLDAAPEVLAARVGPVRDRPLLTEGSAPSTLELLSATRAPAYEAVSDARVVTDGCSVDEVADVVLGELARCGG